MPNTLDTKLQDLAKLAKSVDTAKTDGKGWIWQLIAGFLITIGAWWLRYQLSQKEKELAALKTELENQKLDARNAAIQAKVEANVAEAKKLEESAKASIAAADAAEATLEMERAAHAERVKRLEQIKNFEDLNRLAGIK